MSARERSKPATGKEISLLIEKHTGEMKSDVAELKKDVAVLKTDVAELRKADARLDQKIDRVHAELLRKMDLLATKKDFALLQEQLNRVINTLDWIVGKLKDMDRTVIVFDSMHKDHRLRLDHHETRIRALETK